MTAYEMGIGPLAPKKSFRIMDTDGPRNGRDNSLVVNGAMQGKLNCVNEVFYDITAVPADMTSFRVYDARVSEQSVIVLSPRSVSSLLLFVGAQQQGYFDLIVDMALIGDINAEGSMLEPATEYPLSTTPTKILFDQIGNLPLRLMTFANNELTMQMGGLYRFYLRIEGTLFSNNRLYTFRFQVDRAAGGTDFNDFDFNSGSNATLSEFFSATLDLAEGDVVSMWAFETGTSSPFIYVNLELQRTGNSPTYDNALPEEVLDDIIMKYAVIG